MLSDALANFIRPPNQQTIVLHGVIAQPVLTKTDKIHIKAGTKIAAHVESYFEVYKKMLLFLIMAIR